MDFNTLEIGQGQVEQTGKSVHLKLPPVAGEAYHDAQISTYQTRRDFRHQPPLRLSLRARFAGKIKGTAGFGFWNHPFAPNERSVRLPKVVWFFYGSPPNNMALAKGVPGHGWKAATFDATGWPFLALLPFAPIGFLLMRLRPLYERLWPVGQRAIGVSECALDEDMMQEWHDYALDWHEDGVTFRIDGDVVHQTHHAPHGRLGFVAWVDNQYAIVTPQGKFGFGFVTVPEEQSLLLEDIQIMTL